MVHEIVLETETVGVFQPLNYMQEVLTTPVSLVQSIMEPPVVPSGVPQILSRAPIQVNINEASQDLREDNANPSGKS